MKSNLSLYLLLGLAFAAFGCEPSDGGSSTDAGEMAGEMMAGEVAGEEAGEMAGEMMAGEMMAGEMMAGEMMNTGNGTCDAPYTFNDNGNGLFTVEGVLNGDDSQGSCSNPEAVAEDAVISFTAPETGTYRFDTTENFGIDTVIYLQSACGDTTSELACNDDFGSPDAGEVQSEIIIDLEAGQELFLVVDTFETAEGSEGAAFSARAEKITATAPVLEAAEVVFSNRDYFLAARVSGSDMESDVKTIGFIFTIDGAAQDPIEVPFADFGDIVFDGTSFTGNVLGGLGEEFAGITSVQVYVTDALGLSSEMLEVMVGEPSQIEVDGACDLADGFSECGEGTQCIPESEEVSTGTCQTVFPPVIEMGVAAYNAEANTVGFTVSGTDLTAMGADVDGVEVTFLDANGEDLLGQPVALAVDIVVDEMDMSKFTATFSGSWVDPAEMIAGPTTISVVASDALGLTSEAFSIEVGTPVMANEGDACDTYGALSVCGEGFICVETCTSSESLDNSCPMDWTVTALELDTATMGDNSASMITADGGSCGGGGASDVYSFTAATAGTYSFTANGDADTVDMLIYARSYCSSYIPSLELACNDDIDTENMNYNSSIDVELAEGETTYLFIDSYAAQSTGAYTVTATMAQ
jgi:hypothetical protein